MTPAAPRVTAAEFLSGSISEAPQSRLPRSRASAFRMRAAHLAGRGAESCYRVLAARTPDCGSRTEDDAGQYIQGTLMTVLAVAPAGALTWLIAYPDVATVPAPRLSRNVVAISLRATRRGGTACRAALECLPGTTRARISRCVIHRCVFIGTIPLSVTKFAGSAQSPIE
jgi:hypothetical protein